MKPTCLLLSLWSLDLSACWANKVSLVIIVYPPFSLAEINCHITDPPTEAPFYTCLDIFPNVYVRSAISQQSNQANKVISNRMYLLREKKRFILGPFLTHHFVFRKALNQIDHKKRKAYSSSSSSSSITSPKPKSFSKSKSWLFYSNESSLS